MLAGAGDRLHLVGDDGQKSRAEVADARALPCVGQSRSRSMNGGRRAKRRASLVGEVEMCVVCRKMCDVSSIF